MRSGISWIGARLQYKIPLGAICMAELPRYKPENKSQSATLSTPSLPQLPNWPLATITCYFSSIKQAQYELTLPSKQGLQASKGPQYRNSTCMQMSIKCPIHWCCACFCNHEYTIRTTMVHPISQLQLQLWYSSKLMWTVYKILHSLWNFPLKKTKHPYHEL